MSDTPTSNTRPRRIRGSASIPVRCRRTADGDNRQRAARPDARGGRQLRNWLLSGEEFTQDD